MSGEDSDDQMAKTEEDIGSRAGESRQNAGERVVVILIPVLPSRVLVRLNA